MAKELRIYPGIGIARLGDHPNAVFLSPEVSGIGPLELTSDDAITAIAAYRADGQVRRQGARFRVYEVETDASGKVTQHREITADEANIEWRVELGNQKAAAGRFLSEDEPESADDKRNPGVASDQLVIRPTFPSIAGKNQSAAATQVGRFKGQDVYLGELRTDHKGRLIVLGGRGRSASVPAGKPVGDEDNPSGNNFANNEFWYDDVSDGPVSATVTLPGKPPVEVKDAWVIVAPPDFAPYTLATTSLYDVAFHAGVLNGKLAVPAEPSFKRDILPVLQAVSNYRWVSDFSFWENFPRDWAALGLKANGPLRLDARNKLNKVTELVANLSFTKTQIKMLDLWKDGTFIEDFAAPDPLAAIDPEGLDRASMTQGVGGGFFPGIEAGIITTYKELYAAPFRITRAPFEHDGRAWTPSAGFLTRNMACPWQADFWECKWQGIDIMIWWPAQRPLHVRRAGDPATKIEWDRGIADHRALVKHAMELGFISQRVAGADGVFETERVLTEA